MSETTASPRSRLRVLDGLRGFAIVLVVLSHTWIVAPVWDEDNGAYKVLMSSGNYAVTIFFVIRALLATRGMLRQVDRGGGSVPIGSAPPASGSTGSPYPSSRSWP